MLQTFKETGNHIQTDAENSTGLDKVPSLAGEQVRKRDFSKQNHILNPG
jgi:hypothetical protein